MCIAVFPLCAALEGLEHERLVFNVLGLSVECIVGAAALLAITDHRKLRCRAAPGTYASASAVSLGAAAWRRGSTRDAARLADYLLANVANDSKAVAASRVVQATVLSETAPTLR
jgi:hypothetical protein